MTKVRTTKGKKESDAEAGAGGGVGQHAGAVVLAEHDEDAGADEQPQEPGARPETGAGTLGRDPLAVVGAVDIFVGDMEVGGFDHFREIADQSLSPRRH